MVYSSHFDLNFFGHTLDTIFNVNFGPKEFKITNKYKNYFENCKILRTFKQPLVYTSIVLLGSRRKWHKIKTSVQRVANSVQYLHRFDNIVLRIGMGSALNFPLGLIWIWIRNAGPDPDQATYNNKIIFSAKSQNLL